MYAFFIKKYSYSLKEQVLNPRKVYCIDTGLRNTVAFAFSEDYGRLVENIVFMHLRRKYRDIYYWKNEKQKEVDFLVNEKNVLTQAVQVCWDIESEMTRKRETEGLLLAMDSFELNEGLILTEDVEEEIMVENKKIIFMPVWKWLLVEGET
ncbi:DUF4143 domain-containing protein [Methanosarcina siciliae]|nr:DUF4143 domain-containing protein [Methanosarcina siciliae]